MSTQYYLKTIPENTLAFNISKKVRTSLIEEHNLNSILLLLKNETKIENETVRVINKGVRGPYADGYYCGFNFDDEFEFWKTLVTQFQLNGLLNIIFAEYLVQKDKNYDSANQFYKKGFDIDFRLIGFIEPSWRDELIERNFDFQLVYLQLQKEQYDLEDFVEVIESLIAEHSASPDRIERIKKIQLSS